MLFLQKSYYSMKLLERALRDFATAAPETIVSSNIDFNSSLPTNFNGQSSADFMTFVKSTYQQSLTDNFYTFFDELFAPIFLAIGSVGVVLNGLILIVTIINIAQGNRKDNKTNGRSNKATARSKTSVNQTTNIFNLKTWRRQSRGSASKSRSSRELPAFSPQEPGQLKQIHFLGQTPTSQSLRSSLTGSVTGSRTNQGKRAYNYPFSSRKNSLESSNRPGSNNYNTLGKIDFHKIKKSLIK